MDKDCILFFSTMYHMEKYWVVDELRNLVGGKVVIIFYGG